MSTVQPQIDSDTQATPVLKPVLDTRYALTKTQAAIVVPFVLLFTYVSHLPIHTSVWRRVLTGETILNAKSLPSHSVSVPLTAGRDSMAVSWLTDVVLAGLHRAGGPLAMIGFAAVATLLMSVLWSATVWSWTGRKRWILAAFGLLTAAWWRYLPQHGSLHTEGLCLAAFGWLVLRKSAPQQPSGFRILSLCGLMAVWANMGVSFLFGLAVLLFFAVETAIQKFCASRAEGRNWSQSVLRLASDHDVQQSWWVFAASFLACCLTPHHFRIWPALFRSHANPLRDETGGFAPLVLAGYSGIVLSLTLALVLYAATTFRRLSPAGWLTIVGGTIAVSINEHLLNWFVPVAIAFAARCRSADVELTANASPKVEPQDEPEHKPLMFAWSLISALLIWCGFALSPLSSPLLSKNPPPQTALLADSTPVAVTNYLAENPPTGLVWATGEWSDWIAFRSDDQTAVFTNSKVAQLPRHARRDYVAIYKGQHNWQRSADRYAIQTLIVDKAKQRGLEIELRKSSDWDLKHEDAQAMILTRRELK